VVYVRNGSCTAGSEVGCNDDSASCFISLGTERGSLVTVDVISGQTYFIIVDGFGVANGGFILSVQLND
jgi:hypothetical protein